MPVAPVRATAVQVGSPRCEFRVEVADFQSGEQGFQALRQERGSIECTLALARDAG